MEPPEGYAAKFWGHVAKSDQPDACWEWNGGISTSGYGSFIAEGRHWPASRYSFHLAYGVVPDGLFVCHTCDNRACVRNDDVGIYMLDGIAHPRRGHLWLGTIEENNRDAVAKGRHVNQVHAVIFQGENNTSAKLTEAQVREIRVRYAADGVSQPMLAAEFGVVHSVIGSVVRRETWKHVD